MINPLFAEDQEYFKYVEYLTVEKLMDYSIGQRYQRDKKLRIKFINEVFLYLSDKFPNWRENEYYKKRNSVRRMIETNITFTKMYCSSYMFFKGGSLSKK